MVNHLLEDSRNYIVMELAGPDLKTLLSKKKFLGFAPIQFRFIAQQVIESLECKIEKFSRDSLLGLHGYGIVHGDLKPENILLLNSTIQQQVN